jgi:hypothetical protein
MPIPEHVRPDEAPLLHNSIVQRHGRALGAGYSQWTELNLIWARPEGNTSSAAARDSSQRMSPAAPSSGFDAFAYNVDLIAQLNPTGRDRRGGSAAGRCRAAMVEALHLWNKVGADARAKVVANLRVAA